jgi:hypothetical protein
MSKDDDATDETAREGAEGPRPTRDDVSDRSTVQSEEDASLNDDD